MQIAERRRVILQDLAKLGRVRVGELARKLGAQADDIRQDLEALEKAGKLVRSSGGAIPVERDRQDIPFDERESRHIEAKISIAALAMRKIQPGDCIFLDASSTAYNMARLIPDMPITVVTNEMQIVLELAKRPQVQVVCVGGDLDAPSLSVFGKKAEQFIAQYKFDKCFVSCRGVDLKKGLSEVSSAQATLKKKALAQSRHKFLLADQSKFGVMSSFFIAKLSDVDVIITDSGALPALRDYKGAPLNIEIAR